MFQAGMDDFVRKPYRFNEIYASLARRLGFEYVYAGIDAPADTQDVLTPAMLSGLPMAAREEQDQALESLPGQRAHFGRHRQDRSPRPGAGTDPVPARQLLRLPGHPASPRSGGVGAIFRHARDPRGDEPRRYRARGIDPPPPGRKSHATDNAPARRCRRQGRVAVDDGV